MNELGRAAFSCSISDWNPDWDIFISTSWKQDEEGNPINPQLYRDTDLTLTWEYFGFTRDLYKPEGYPSGIYLWNPRSWEKDNPSFSFEELIRTGAQYVVYPCFEPDTYKLWAVKNIIADYDENYVSGGSLPQHIYNPGLFVNLTTPNNGLFSEYYTDTMLSKNQTSATLHVIGEVLPYDEVNGSTTLLPGGTIDTQSGNTHTALYIGARKVPSADQYYNM